MREVRSRQIMTIESNDNNEPPRLGEFGGHESYPMPMFVTLAVADVAAVASWYERTLGFAIVFQAPGSGGKPSLVHLRRRKYQDVLMTPLPPDAVAVESPSNLIVSFSAEGEVDALADRARGSAPFGQSAIAGPIDTPWNTRDLRVTDPAGHRLVFTGRNPNPDPESAARMKAMFDRSRER
jgi:catechol 2,3-dioxygenase-like lactoylglutathione lyase family enzyme